jgi:hypothetical protein
LPVTLVARAGHIDLLRVLSGFVGRGDSCVLSVVSLSGPARLSSLLCGKLQSFFADAVAPNTFLRQEAR